MLTFFHFHSLTNVVNNPQIKETQKTTIAEFTIVANNKNKGEEASFITVVCFGKLAIAVGEYAYKGMPIFLDGELVQQKFTNKNNQEVTIFKVLANKVVFLGKKPGSYKVPDEEVPY